MEPNVVNLWYFKLILFDHNRSHSLKCQSSTIMESKDIGIIKSEFVAKTQFLCLVCLGVCLFVFNKSLNVWTDWELFLSNISWLRPGRSSISKGPLIQRPQCQIYNGWVSFLGNTRSFTGTNETNDLKKVGTRPDLKWHPWKLCLFEYELEIMFTILKSYLF